MGRRLLLKRLNTVEVNYQYLGAYRLRIEASDPSGSGADPYVFLYNRRPINPYPGAEGIADDFVSITSPTDLAEYPIGEPRDGTAYPFFRLDFLELDFRATSQAEHTWVTIIGEVGVLLESLDRLEQLVETAEVWVGSNPENSDSASDSTSQSV
jgi:hypothetical protein